MSICHKHTPVLVFLLLLLRIFICSKGARRGTMPNSHRMMTNNSCNGKNSLTFESVVCSQLELKRRAASFSRRRSTMCRRTSAHIPAMATASNNSLRKSSPIGTDFSAQFLKMKKLDNDVKRSRTSSINSTNGVGMKTNADRQSVVSMIYWDGSSSRNAIIKKVEHLSVCLVFESNI